MGKAATELPDALDPTDMAEKAAAVDVDELLAQMAGEEIDRLLSEGDDVPRPRQPKPAAAPTPAAHVAQAAPEPAVPDPIDEAVSHQLDETVDATTLDDAAVAEAPAAVTAAPVTEVAAPAPTPAAPPAPDDPLAKQLDDLFAQLEGTDAPAPSASASAPASAPAAAAPSPAVAEATPPVAAPELAPAPAPPVEEPIATSAQERSALDAPMPAAEILSEGQEADDESLPWYLKPLEWINAPLDALPDPIRELIGKLGLLTLFNACAVFLYVYVFRKHHR